MNTLEKINIIPQAETDQRAVMTPMDMLEKALSQSANIDVLEKLMGMQERWEAAQARKAFDNALAAAKAAIPVIVKNRLVDYSTSKGQTTYKHEDLAEIAKTVTPILAANGLSYRYRVTSNPSEPVIVGCIISHRDGHSEELATLSAGRDDSGSKNSIQAIGSTLTYLQRMTLKAALGLAAAHDDDARTAEPVEKITQEQADALGDVIEAAGKNRARFLKWAKVERLEDIEARHYQACVEAANYKAPQS